MPTDILQFFVNYYSYLIVGALLLALIVAFIIYRKKLKTKIETESVSFIALLFSVSMALLSFFSSPKSIPSGTLSLLEGGKIGLVFPITIFLIVLSIIFAVIFFRRELAGK